MRVKNWHKFQHFKDRKPPWIKLYRDLLDDPDWHELDGESAKILTMLWLIASEQEGSLPDLKKLSFRLRQKESALKQTLTNLSHWLEQDDIAMISERHHPDTPETEGETETQAKRQIPRRRGKTELPDDWKPSEGTTDRAKTLGLSDSDIRREIERFKNHASQNARTAANWDAAFRNWCLKAAELLGRQPKETGQPNGFIAPPHTPQFLAWKAYAKDKANAAFVRILDEREQENRAFNFEAEWPPGHQVAA